MQAAICKVNRTGVTAMLIQGVIALSRRWLMWVILVVMVVQVTNVGNDSNAGGL